jgi:hypothetical protein
MKDNYLPAATPPQRGETRPPESGGEPGKADDRRHRGVQAGRHVAGAAREHASGVAAEAGRQGGDLLRQAQGQLGEQAARGQQQLANRLFSLSDELDSMVSASGQRGMAGVASQAASRVRAAGQWLEARKPGQVADDVQSFARSRPAIFLVLAAGAGLVAGRLTCGLNARR